MSDHEFENYLTLISRFLRLSRTQREAIGEELRDHFESRLAELIDAGKSHHDAVRLALAEFGDAAGLAAEFTHISIAHRRRLVMRCTVASVAALAAAVLVAMAVWPENRAGQGARNALAENAVRVPEKSGAASVPTEDSLTAETEAKLQRFLSVEVADQPLSEYMASLADQLKIQVIFDTAALRDATIDPSTTPVGLVLKNVRGKTLLSFVLGEHNLTYIVRDGILMVTTTDKANAQLTTRIYDCREILAADRPENRPWDVAKPTLKIDEHANEHTERPSVPGGVNPLMARYTGNGGDHAPMNENTENQNIKTATQNGTVIKHYFTGTPPERLINVITTVIASPTWNDVGGQGTIEEYNGLLVVSQTPEVHEQVATLLDQIAGKLAATKK